MTRYEVDTEGTRLDVRVEPHLFGFRVRIQSVTGQIEATRDGDGRIDLGSAVGVSVTMNINDLDFGSSLLTRTIRGVVDVAGDGTVTGHVLAAEAGPDDGYRFSFEVESGSLRGRLQATCRVEWRDDGAAVVRGSTAFRATDFDIHVPGIDHLRGTCDWTVLAVPHPAD